jgi:Asp-tRNA(Asn)/Glu-tRNA(Gln) amidotransferase A subunit family amidase
VVSGATYSAALRTRFECIRRLERLCDDYQLLACPTVSLVPPTLDELSGPAGQRDMFAYVASTFLANLSGFAAATLPAGSVSGAPVGLQLMAPPDGEPLLLRAARVFEQLRPWSGERPPLGERRPSST